MTMPLQFKEYTKKALTRARKLTQSDFDLLDGTIQTLEGPSSFTVGDYLAHGIEGEEWPIGGETFRAIYELTSEPQDSEGFLLWRKRTTVQAAPIPHGVHVTIKKGDTIHEGRGYGATLVYTGTDLYIAKTDIFEQTYELATPPATATVADVMPDGTAGTPATVTLTTARG